MKKIKKKPILLFVIAVIALYIIIYVVPKVTGALTSEYTVEYGELKIGDEVSCCIVRNEKVYLAGSGGKTNYYIKEGTMCRKGTGVMEVPSGSDKEVAGKYSDILSRLSDNVVNTKDFSIEESGIVSFYTDGYEAQITPKSMKKGDYEYYSKRNNDSVMELERDQVSKGEPVFKVVDRTLWYMVYFVDSKEGEKYEKGAKVSVEFEDGEITASVYAVDKDNSEENGDLTRIILSTDNYYDRFAQVRTADIYVVLSHNSGLIIHNSSIGEEKGVKGVYVKNKAGDYVFTPIKVISTDGENSVIQKSSYYDDEGKLVETVDTYDDILKNAK